MAHLAQASDGFGPPKGLLDPLADALGDFVADMPRGSPVDCRAPPALVLRDMRGA